MKSNQWGRPERKSLKEVFRENNKTKEVPKELGA